MKHRTNNFISFAVMGLWCMAAFAFFLAIGTTFLAWSRPVSLISNIPGASDIVDNEGKVRYIPYVVKYFGTDLERDDQIDTIDGKKWLEAFHLNLHELPQKEVGDEIVLSVKRDGDQKEVRLKLQEPSIWESLWLIRYGIAGLITLILPITTLILVQRQQKRKNSQRALFSNDWTFGWILLSIGLSISGYKYPTTVTIGDALAPVIALYIGSISFPYPYSSRALRCRPLFWAMNGLGIAIFCFVVWRAVSLGEPSEDFLYRLVRLSPAEDTLGDIHVFFVSQIMAAIGLAFAVVGILILGFFQKLVGPRLQLHHLPKYIPHNFKIKILSVCRYLYREQPANIHIIAIFQVLIIFIYVIQDIIPRLDGYPTVGYSILISLIPVSYLLLYVNPTRQSILKQTWLFIIALVVLLQLVSIYVHIYKAEFWGGTASLYSITIFVFLAGLLVGIPMAIYLQKREPDGKVLRQIDSLFDSTNQRFFWKRLTRIVGPSIGAENWLWITQSYGGETESTDISSSSNSESLEWKIQFQTSKLPREWLTQSFFNEIFHEIEKTELHSVTLLRDPFPLFIKAFPIYSEFGLAEYLFTFNPRPIKDKILLNSPEVTSRITQAIKLLHNREEREQTTLQHNERLEILGAALLESHEKEKGEWSAWLHNEPLNTLCTLNQNLKRLCEGLADTPQRRELSAMIEKYNAVYIELRELSTKLKPPGISEDLHDALKSAIDEWESDYPENFFYLRFEGEDQLLTEHQTRWTYQIIKQAVDNALQHANCTEIEILVDIDEEQMKAQVKDNGCGFDINQIRPDAIGLEVQKIIAERILDGQLDIDSQPDAGCRVVFTLPLGNS